MIPWEDSGSHFLASYSSDSAADANRMNLRQGQWRIGPIHLTGRASGNFQLPSMISFRGRYSRAV
jgi:hypothetical protein